MDAIWGAFYKKPAENLQRGAETVGDKIGLPDWEEFRRWVRYAGYIGAGILALLVLNTALPRS